MNLYEIGYYYGSQLRVHELYADNIKDAIYIIECNPDLFYDIDVEEPNNIIFIKKVKI